MGISGHGLQWSPGSLLTGHLGMIAEVEVGTSQETLGLSFRGHSDRTAEVEVDASKGVPGLSSHRRPWQDC